MSHAVLLPFLFISCVLLHTRLQVSRVVLLTEDINYLYAKDGTLRRKTIAVQLGHSPFNYGPVVNLLRNHIVITCELAIAVTSFRSPRWSPVWCIC